MLLSYDRVRMEQKTEAEIVIRVLKGERQAFALLIEEYKNPIYNLAYQMTNNYQDAEDIAQETFLRSFRELSRYDTNRSFYTWLYTISLNLIRNYLKKADRRQTDFQKVNMSSNLINTDIEKAALRDRETDDIDKTSRERENQLELCLQKISPELRELLVLRFYQGLSFETIADITGCSQSAVKMRVYRGLETLRKIIQKM